MATPQQEAEARKAGFQTYEQMKVFILSRQNNKGNARLPIMGETPSQEGGSIIPKNALSWHPAVILQGISDFFGKLNSK